jgi:hypothetical protein
LFNGKDLSGWEENKFGGAGEVKVEGGEIRIGSGVALTGIRRAATNDLLRTNYEVSLQAMKVQGGDFFCGLTFPVKDSHMTLVVGGWGGSLVGVSSIDGWTHLKTNSPNTCGSMTRSGITSACA